MKTPALLLFAKQPLAGAVKTRLQPQCNPQQAADIADFAIRASVQLAVSYWPGEVTLCGWPDCDHFLFREMAEQYHIHLANQDPGDLGEKMQQALAQAIAISGAAAVMGCDVPQCTGPILEQAFEALARSRNVLGPTLDGGYYFIGLQHSAPRLFEAIDWGSDHVLKQTQARAQELGVEFEMLTRLRDIDTWEDLRIVSQTYPPLRPYVAACTGSTNDAKK